MSPTQQSSSHLHAPDEPPRAGYPFKGVPLRPGIAEALIAELFAGKRVERKAIVEEVHRQHIARGGRKARGGNPIPAIKKALQTMRKKGLAESPSPGYWDIIGGPCAPGPDPPDEDGLVRQDKQEGPIEQPSPAPEPPVEREIGSGHGAVYLYYLPTYRQCAEQRGEKAWPCKIGRTDGDPLARILAQAATALPEKPTIALVVRTSDPATLETAVHAALTLRGLRLQGTPGSE